MNEARLRAAYDTAVAALLAERHPDGYWVGELSASALSTATAITALHLTEPMSPLIAGGVRWLITHQNADGGWGDTVQSVSNISTTMLCRAALHLTGHGASETVTKCDTWLASYGKTPAELAEAIRARYGKDRTFSVPILMMCALAKLVTWEEVPRLPFELAALPQSWYRFARLPVVSYALPALIAIGQVIHHERSTWNPLTRSARWFTRRRTFRVLERIQPSSGGYLEATPLTSFVVMSLAHIAKDRPLPESAQRVLAKGLEFVRASVLPDGSWAIDSNLSVWVTTLSVVGLEAGDNVPMLPQRPALLAWLLNQQTSGRHPFTGAAEGAWGWSHLPGSVPDCDDTPGALLALHALADQHPYQPALTLQTAFIGVRWVLDLQNRNGGWPTFCRGWGKLPFDRSGADLTAHALRALHRWLPDIADESFAYRLGSRYYARIVRRIERATERGLAYLSREQRADGSWLPLWFGNQHTPDDINPVYGTAKVLAAYRDLRRMDDLEAQRGVAFLLSIQNTDGGWGGAAGTPSSVEETALIVEVLAAFAPTSEAYHRGLTYLVERVEQGTFTEASPIGFYFAKLWYFEKLYPFIFTVAALGKSLAK